MWNTTRDSRVHETPQWPYQWRDCGPVVSEPVWPLQTTDGTTYLVADSALYSAEHLQRQADTGTTWMTRVPATLTAAPHALEQATPEAMVPLQEGDRDHVRAAT